MAYIGKIPSGKYQAQVRLPNGKRTTRTHRLKKVVETWARELEVAIDAGRWVDPDTVLPYAAWRERFMAARDVQPETLRGDISVMNTHIAPFFDDMALAAIRPSTVKTWLAKMKADGVGDAARVRAFNLFRTSMRLAEADGLVVSEPTAKVDGPTVPASLIHWYTHQQVEAIVAALTPRDAVMAELMAWTALRWGEAAGLRAGDVDVSRRRISVTQTVSQAGKIKAYPKNDPSVREIPVPAHVLERMSPVMAGRGPVQLIFRTASGSPLNGSNFRTAWYKALERAQVEGKPVPVYPPHSLRHTGASWLVQAGVPLKEVQRMLGHSSPVMTNRYAHLVPDAHSAVENAWTAMRPAPP